ncbi:MAG: FAD-dependent monooxygenase [Bacteroidota bacterium]|nr:FAD-dependent monooxygenase [Bacteroidota bacterium]MDX5430763.1 FAD-dependent monooxygenase [Bacteroidota bacterium]MDX5469508.1 FAD-dependent monooxygenase [Bacteroidota bacterium]
MNRITLIGGGLSGSLMAVYLAKRGFEVNVYERRPDMRNNRMSAGKSINLALSVRGLRALEKVGLDKEILKQAIPMYGRTMHSVDGQLSYQPYGKEGQAIYSVSRGLLNIRLLELADEYPNIHLHFEHRCVDVDLDAAKAIFVNAEGQEVEVIGDRIIGTDGAFAATRGRLQITDRFNYSQSYLEHGYKELLIPPGEGGQFLMKKESLHIWPRGHYMMIALPNPPGDYTCTLFFPFEGEESFASLQTEEQVENFFKKRFPDAVPMMPTLIEDFFSNPTSSLVTVKCYPWVKDDKLALLGDAAHAIVPFFGQGMNCAFEDCVVMDECIEKHGNDWGKVFAEYQKLRKVNADAIADLAVQNFVEMRDKVGDENFLHMKRIEHDLCDLYPESYMSQYEMVTFSNIPYSEALAMGSVNERILNTIIREGVDIKDEAKIKSIIHREKGSAHVG